MQNWNSSTPPFANLIMKNIADTTDFNAVIQRINALTSDAPRLWGTMTPAQMLLHCRIQIGFGTGEVKSKKLYPAPIQWLIKQTVGFRIPWSKNLPTAPAMVSTAKDGLDFETEKAALQATIAHFAHLPTDATLAGHPIFGAMNKDEWGRIIYKHLDHHLRQFGV
jgi:hypothetical protein